MLTMHELFHVVRGYNGRKVCEKPICRLYLESIRRFMMRQKKGGGTLQGKSYFHRPKFPVWKDYHLRFMAAYYLSEEVSFEESGEKLIELGAEPERAFDLLARNREALRHHIYLNGYHKWKNLDETGLFFNREDRPSTCKDTEKRSRSQRDDR